MGSIPGKIADVISFIVKHPIPVIVIIGGVILISIAAFIIYHFMKGNTPKKDNDSHDKDQETDTDEEIDTDEDCNVINKTRGKTKTNL